MLRLDGDDTVIKKPKGIWTAKGGKGFTGYQPGNSSLKGTKSPGSWSTCPPSPFVDTGHGWEIVQSNDRHVCYQVCTAVEMLHHKRNVSPLVRDVRRVTVNPWMEWLTHFTHVLKATPPVCNQINNIGGLTGGTKNFTLSSCSVIWLENSSVTLNIH